MPPPEHTESAPASPAPSSPASAPAPQIVVVSTVVVPVVVAVPVPISTSPLPHFSEKKLPAAEENFSEEKKLPAEQTSPSAFSGFWRKFGGTGFVVSAVFHFALAVFALLFVFAEYSVPAEAEAMFISGSGGGNGAASGANARGQTERAFRRSPPAEKFSPKIVSRSQTARVALPEIPAISVPMPGASALKNAGAGATAGGGSTGVGGGFGGGIGTGIGVGIGGGKNFIGKFKTLLGAEIRAERIAVYLDCSGSMKRYLPAVKAEIYEKFPDADVFAYSGALTEIRDGEIVGGRAAKAKTLAASAKKLADDETETEKLSPAGRTLHRKFSARFAAGTTGAWLDILSRERYDALVVFSDFRDGIRQRRDGKTVFADSTYSPTPDARTERERRWETEWLAAFSRAGAPKLYLFSTRTPPQAFLEKCATTSGGSVTILSMKKRATEASGD